MSQNTKTATALITQVEAQLAALAPTGRIWLGYSGGLDSSVLLHLLASHQAFKSRLAALHIHHGLSPHADAWLTHCRQQCQALGVPFYSAKVQLVDCSDGVEAAARQARYQVFIQHCQAGDLLCLAQHADDQIETFMQRLLRGAGVSGLAAMPLQRELTAGVYLCRPLLAFSRAQLAAYAQTQQLTWVEDESNQDNRYERNWWRNQLLPQLWQKFPQRKANVLRSIAQLSADRLLLEELLAPAVERVINTWPWPYSLPLALNLEALQAEPEHHWPYLLRAWLKRLGLNQPSQEWYQQCVKSVMAAAADAQPSLSIGGYQLRRQQQQLFLYQAPPCAATQLIALNATAEFSWQGLSFIAKPGEGLKPNTYLLCQASQAQGLGLRPKGRPYKKLKALLQEAKIPAALRPIWPVLMLDQELVAVVGVAMDAEYFSATGWQLHYVTDNNHS